MEKHLKCQAYTSCLQFVLWAEGKGKVPKTMSKSPFQEVGFLTEKKKENSSLSCLQSKNLVIFVE
jgi:hypothetical protein